MDTKASPHLGTIYAPVHRDLELLGRFLAKEFADPDPMINDILRHVARFCGKQMRPALLFLAGRMRGETCTPEHIKIGAVVELIHTATLVHDDILDAALIRRKVEAVHRRWGERAAVLIGDFIYSRAFHLSTQVDGMSAVLSDTTQTICEGELLQLENRFFPEISESSYLHIIGKKTAILYAVSCELGGTLSGFAARDCRQLRRYGADLGMAFQIVDDCLDYTGKESETGKSLGTDLHQNKTTLPLIYLMDCLPPSQTDWLKEKLAEPLTAEVERHIQHLVHAHGVIDESLRRAECFVQSARESLREIDGLGQTAPEILESLDLVGDYIIRRPR